MLQVTVKLQINDKIYQKNPEETELGRRIVQHSILLIDEIGLECFTFKKLAEQINSTEASVYRYFENKHLLFVYLANWYWEWVRFHILFFTANLKDPVEKLRSALRVVVNVSQRNATTEYVDTESLHRILVTEGAKAYHHKAVDEDNQYGFFWAYKSLCATLAEFVQEINPSYPYPRSLSSMLLETANNNIYFARHLPRLTDIQYKQGYLEEIVEMLTSFALAALSTNTLIAPNSKHDKAF
jgi:AcrR family transcriptional regulator